MSKVYLAVSRGAVDDVRKLVVLKVLHEHLIGNEEYVEMFLREAKIAVDLSHPNVVHTYTVGQEDDRYCIVMEYINGIPLSKVLSRARSEDWSFEQRMPLLGALCLMLSGLNYVHDFRDLEGNLLRLVHRDLKPGNVLLGFDGQVKLLDFGVAKMTAPEHDQTERLSLKGTVQYLAPEALQGARQIDRRYDVFAAGLILWEIVTGKRMWANRQPLEVMRGLADDEMAKFVDEEPDIPEELRPILLKALAADRDVRYRTALDLKSAIQSFIQKQGMRIDPEQLARIVNDGFGPVRDERQAVVSQRLRNLREGVEVGEPQVLQAGGPDSLSSGIASASATDLGTSDPSLTPPSPMTRPETDNTHPPAPGQQRGRGGLWAALLAVPLLGAGAYVLLSDNDVATEPAASTDGVQQATKAGAPPSSDAPQQPATPEPAAPDPEVPIKVTVVVNPSTASVEVDGEVRSDSPIVLEGTDPTQSYQIVASADGYATETLDLELTRSRTLDIELQPLSAAASDERPTRRRRGRRGANAQPRPEPASPEPVVDPAPAPPARPKSPRPGDDIAVRRGKKRGADAPEIDSEIPWK